MSLRATEGSEAISCHGGDCFVAEFTLSAGEVFLAMTFVAVCCGYAALWIIYASPNNSRYTWYVFAATWAWV